MSTGQLVFFSGVGLLGFTMILGIIFLVKRPQYIPESVAYASSSDQSTRKLRSGYPTDRLTIRREPEQRNMEGTIPLPQNTARLETEQAVSPAGTVVLQSTEPPREQKTEKLNVGTLPLAEGTMSLIDGKNTSAMEEAENTMDRNNER